MNQQVEKFVSLVRQKGPTTAVREVYKWVLKNSGLRLPDTIQDIEPGASSRKVYHRTPTDEGIMPLPPLELMVSVGSHNAESFLIIGDVWSQLLKRLLPASGASVLDIGVGCGRVTRFMVNDPRVDRYVGFDVIDENIQWCKNHIQPLSPARAEFHSLDIYSREYNPTGALKADQIRFPGEDSGFDLVYASSLFTHLLEKDSRHYMAETRRVLKPSGKAVFSAHCAPKPGERATGNESRIDYDESFFVSMARDAGLRLEKSLKNFSGQDVFIFVRA